MDLFQEALPSQPMVGGVVDGRIRAGATDGRHELSERIVDRFVGDTHLVKCGNQVARVPVVVEQQVAKLACSARQVLQFAHHLLGPLDEPRVAQVVARVLKQPAMAASDEPVQHTYEPVEFGVMPACPVTQVDGRQPTGEGGERGLPEPDRNQEAGGERTLSQLPGVTITARVDLVRRCWVAHRQHDGGGGVHHVQTAGGRVRLVAPQPDDDIDSGTGHLVNEEVEPVR